MEEERERLQRTQTEIGEITPFFHVCHAAGRESRATGEPDSAELG